MNKTQRLYSQAKRMIPGGTQLFSKRPELHLPGQWPAYYEKAKGCSIWDLDGKKYIDACFMGIGSCVLGYADPDVDRAVTSAVKRGSMTTLNCPEEVKLAEVMLDLHPWAQMVRYARTGGEAMSIAVRIARASTQKNIILFCGYHGWHDWYLAANLTDKSVLNNHLLSGLNPAGVPDYLKGSAFGFTYNNSEEFMRLLRKYQGKIAAVVMEPLRNFYPEGNFLQFIREETRRKNIPLIFDEITSGWRLNLGGAHLELGVMPDIAVFGKAISNGYPMAVIIGTRKMMEGCQKSFISSTYWTERIGPAAALACIEKMKQRKIPQHLMKIGMQVQQLWQRLAREHDLNIKVSGIPPLGHFSFESEDSLLLKTLFTQFMLERGFLATTSFYVSYAHGEPVIKSYGRSVDESFEKIAKAVRQGNAAKYLKGPVCHSGFKRLN